MKELLNIMLQKLEIRRLYSNLLERTHKYFDTKDFDDVYNTALQSFLSNLQAVSELWEHWGVYGVTLPTKEILIDMPTDKDCTLIRVYQTIICLHEYTHYVLRVQTTTWGQFFDITTPPRESEPNTPIVEPYSHEVQALKEAINVDMPCFTHGEAGDQLVFEIFGMQLSKVVLPGAQQVVSWARGEFTLLELRDAFGKANIETEEMPDEHKLAVHMSPSEEGSDVIRFKGVCGFSGR
jgi:hypothetical protein